MKIFICKLFGDKGIENRIAGLVSRVKKQSGNSSAVFCVDETTHKRLEAAGISNETYLEFDCVDAEDEPGWEIAYKLSDGLRSFISNNETLKYSGIDFLTFEHAPAYYIYAIRLASLFKRMLEKKYEAAIIVIPKNYSIWLRDINSPNIKTVSYNRPATTVLNNLYRRLLYQLSWISKARLKRKSAGTPSAGDDNTGQRKQKALFVVRTPLYTRPAAAIAGQCRQDGLVPWAATDTRDTIPVWQGRNIGYSVKPLFLASLFTLIGHIPEAVLLYFRLKKHIVNFFQSNYPEAMKDDFSPEYLYRNVLLDNLSGLCYEAVTDILFLEKLIKQTKPDILCLMPESHLLEQIAEALGKKINNIPSLACSAAWETGSASAWRRHLHADMLATSGEKMRRLYIDSGVGPERVVATGIAHFDSLFSRNRERDRQSLQERGIELDKKLVIFATDVLLMDEAERMLTGVIDAVVKNKYTSLVVKVHPREEAGPFQTIVDRYPGANIKVFRDIDLYALLNNCELLITKGSTVALEAMMIGKAVIILDLSNNPVAVPYVKEGAALGVYRQENIEDTIFKMLYDEDSRSQLKVKRDEFVRNWAHEPDGRASERIVTLMKDLIGKKKG